MSNLKRIISIILISSMIFTANGFTTLAESIDDFAEQTEEEIILPSEEKEKELISESTYSELEDEEQDEEENLESTEYEEEPEEDEKPQEQNDYEEQSSKEIQSDVEENEYKIISTESETEENVFIIEEEPEGDEEKEEIIATESEIKIIDNQIEESEEEIMATESELISSIEEENEIEIATISSVKKLRLFSLDQEATASEVQLFGNGLFGAPPTEGIAWETGDNWKGVYLYRKINDSENIYIRTGLPTGSDLNEIWQYEGNNNIWKNRQGTAIGSNSIRDKICIIENDIAIDTYKNFFAAGNNTNTNTYKEIQNINKINTSNATDLSYMFAGLGGVNQTNEFHLDLSTFNTSNVTTMKKMFWGVQSNVKSINISSFTFNSLTECDYMFDAYKGQKIYIDPNTWDLNTRDVTSTQMFNNCSNLKGHYNYDIVTGGSEDKTYAKIDRGEGNERGYLSTKIEYTITFKNINRVNNSEITNITDPKESLSILWGTTVPQQADLENDINYVFKGYKSNSTLTSDYSWSTQIFNNTDIYIDWNPIYNISFNRMGHGTVPPSQRRENGTLVENPGNLSEVGWTFGGWYKDSAVTIPWNFNTDVVTADNTIIYAKWTENEYTITYNKNEGNWVDGRSDIATRSFTQSFTLPTEGIITKTGYTFDGWWTNLEYASGTKLEVIPANTDRDFIVYAKWNENNYSITYHNIENTRLAQGYTLKTQRPFTQAVTMPTNTQIMKDNYRLEGWFTTPDFQPATIISQTSSNNENIYNVYAKWVPIEYSITYDKNGGDWVSSYIATTSRTVESPTINLPNSNQIQKRGHTFEGWYTNSQCTGNRVETIVAGQDLRNLQFWAKWSINTYNINYHLEVATNSSTAPAGTATWRSGQVGTYTYGRQVTLSKDVVFDGYKFIDWYDNPNFTGSPITQITNTDVGDKELYGLWQKVPTFTISFSPGSNGSGSMNSIVATQGVQVIIPSNSFTGNTNYVFDYFKDTNGATYNVGQRYLFNQDITLYAQWHYSPPYRPSGGGGGGGGGGRGAGLPANGLSPLSGQTQPDTPEKVLEKINNAPSAPGTFMIIQVSGKGSNDLTTLGTSTNDYKWYYDPVVNDYKIRIKDVNGNRDFVSGWALVELNGGVYKYYLFDPITKTMTKGLYTDPTTKKTYLFEYDNTKLDYGAMIINETRNINGTNLTFNEKGELINSEVAPVTAPSAESIIK